MPEHKEGNKMSGLRTAHRHIEAMLMDPTSHYFGALDEISITFTKDGLTRCHTYKKDSDDVIIKIIDLPQPPSGGN